jgi:hypothetical protein
VTFEKVVNHFGRSDDIVKKYVFHSGMAEPQILADHLTLSQPGGADYGPHKFLDLVPSLTLEFRA